MVTLGVALGLLILRLVLGLTVAAHGAQKLFGWFVGSGLAGFRGVLEKLNIRPAAPFALLAGLGELAGGLLVALGFPGSCVRSFQRVGWSRRSEAAWSGAAGWKLG